MLYPPRLRSTPETVVPPSSHSRIPPSIPVFPVRSLGSSRNTLFQGHFFSNLRTLASDAKIETIFPGRCITVTSASNNSKIYIEGVKIPRPDPFAFHLSPFSCNVQRFASLSFLPPPPSPPSDLPRETPPCSMMRLMISDAMLRLRISGFGILAPAMKVKYAELVKLQNITMFALDDATIFSRGREYISNMRFHIVPNTLLPRADDLNRLPVKMVIPTLEHGQTLEVTDSGSGLSPMRINYVRLKTADVVYNLKIVVHSLLLPFPHLHPRVEGT